ncbi:Myb-like DNA-binding domain protein [Phlyctochytrium bullatum]|nr:Myb-like DNA-binding domain protein [Phlyctochytrium bullatum]
MHSTTTNEGLVLDAFTFSASSSTTTTTTTTASSTIINNPLPLDFTFADLAGASAAHLAPFHFEPPSPPSTLDFDVTKINMANLPALEMPPETAWLAGAGAAGFLMSPPMSTPAREGETGVDEMLDQFLVNGDSDLFDLTATPAPSAAAAHPNLLFFAPPDASALLAHHHPHLDLVAPLDAFRQSTPEASSSPSPRLSPFPAAITAGMVTAPPSPQSRPLPPKFAAAAPRELLPATPAASPVVSARTATPVHPLSSANMNGFVRRPSPALAAAAAAHLAASGLVGYTSVDGTATAAAAPKPTMVATTRKRQRSVKTSTYNKWTPDEDALLRDAVSRHGTQGKWALIAACIPGRTPIQCSTRWTGALNPRIHKGKWSADEDAILKRAFREACERIRADHADPDTAFGIGKLPPPTCSAIPWQRIAEQIPGRTAVQCIARYQEALDPEIRKGKWSAEEDAALREGLRLHGKAWVRIAGLIRGRTQRQCRTRWLQIRARLEAEGIFVAGGGKEEEEEEME